MGDAFIRGRLSISCAIVIQVKYEKVFASRLIRQNYIVIPAQIGWGVHHYAI
jgi:hypothetical protein